MRVLTHLLLWRLGLAEAETQTTVGERECLARHAKGKKRIVEVGVWHGVTTCLLREAMASDGVLFGVDPFPLGRFGFNAQSIIAHAKVSKVLNGSVRWIRSTGADAARYYASTEKERVDFVFIDGDHSYEGLRGDWELWRELVAHGGIIALHDSRSSTARNIDDAGSVIYTSDVILLDKRFKQIEAVDTLTVLSRLGDSH